MVCVLRTPFFFLQKTSHFQSVCLMTSKHPTSSRQDEAALCDRMVGDVLQWDERDVEVKLATGIFSGDLCIFSY